MIEVEKCFRSTDEQLTKLLEGAELVEEIDIHD